MAERDADVVIVGAGPAGSAAAFFLAQSGRSVVLVDRRTFPREKPCGEGVLPAGARVLERMGVVAALREKGARPFRGIRYHAPAGRTADGMFPRGEIGFGVRRAALDDTLLRAAAASARVSLRESFAARELLRDDTTGAFCGVRSEGGEEIRAALVIGADGARSRIRKLAGLDGRATERWGVRQHFRPVEAPPAEEMVDVYVTGTAEAYVTPVAPGEYGVAWLRGDATSSGAAPEGEGAPAREDEGATKGERLIRETLRGRTGIAAALADAPATSEPLAAAGMGSVARSPTADGLLLLGDAAGAPDPITGMGVSFALRCAEGLPEALAGAFAKNDFSRVALSPYLALRRREVAGGFAVTRAVMWLACRKTRAELAIRALGVAPPLFPALFRLAAG